MQFLTTTTMFALHAISTLAAPPARRDEWQPTTTTVIYPEGAPIPAPTDHPNTEWQPQGNQTCIYITSNYEWMGYGINLCNPAGICSDKLPDGLSGKALSVGPSVGQVCFLYSGLYCSGWFSDPIVHPGYSNLNDINFGSRAMSWKCFKMWPAEDPAGPSSSMAATSSSTSSSSTGTAGTSSSVAASRTSSFQNIPISISTTLFPISNPQTTPGGIPISRTQSIIQASSLSSSSSMSTSTLTLTVLSVDPPSTTSSTLTVPTTTSTITVTPIPAPFSASSETSFDTALKTFVTHTFADGTVTTTSL